jgi:isochorismate hydrolase
LDVKKSLIDVNDCVLIIVDVQDYFLGKLPAQRARQLVSRVGWLIEIAKILNVPIVVTAEEETRLGGVFAVLGEKLPSGTTILDKRVFGLAEQPNILNAVREVHREIAVLVGLETDVCIAHSAIGLMQEGFQVVVLGDVTDSPGEGHLFGLRRVERAGALVISLKGLYYEWIRTVSKSNLMNSEHLKRIGLPGGIVL